MNEVSLSLRLTKCKFCKHDKDCNENLTSRIACYCYKDFMDKPDELLFGQIHAGIGGSIAMALDCTSYEISEIEFDIIVLKTYNRVMKEIKEIQLFIDRVFHLEEVIWEDLIIEPVDPVDICIGLGDDEK